MSAVDMVLFCKTYPPDLLRLQRLAASIQKHNKTQIPFYVSVPSKDLSLFQRHLGGFPIHWLTDEQILATSPLPCSDSLATMTGGQVQQVVKSEFWRLGHANSYLCLDADAFFIKDFDSSHFLAANGTPYTTIDEGHDLLETALKSNKPRVLGHFLEESKRFQHLLGRQGKHYSFGPLPVIWHRAVWESLDREFLRPRNMSFADAIALAPIETRWYGEALLQFRAIPLLPTQALFKVYHYAWQYDLDRRHASFESELKQLYCGMIHQSAWDKALDWPQEPGTWCSKLARRIRRWLGRM